MDNNLIFCPLQTTPFTLKTKIKSHLWQLINKTIFRLLPLRCKWYRIGLLRLFGAKLADDVTIDGSASIDHPWNLVMGNLSSLGEGSWIYCLGPIAIGSNCCIGKNVYLITGSHDVNDLNFGYVIKGIIVDDGCWIATGSYVLPGVNLGKYTVVGALSLVTKNTEPYSVVGGNPAKFIKKRDFAQL